LDLHTAAKRYEEQRRFWAREIADVLHQKTYRSRLSLLQRLVALGEPMTALGLSDCLPSQKGTRHNLASFASGLLKDLVEVGLVTRTRSQYSYWYVPTELADLVLAYLPLDEPVPLRPPPSSSNGVHRESDAEEVVVE
jgi:hypothetical protein